MEVATLKVTPIELAYINRLVMEGAQNIEIVVIKKVPRTYICPFCGYSRSHRNKTEIKYRGRWMQGCQGCFLSSVENQKVFNSRPLKIIQDEL